MEQFSTLISTCCSAARPPWSHLKMSSACFCWAPLIFPRSVSLFVVQVYVGWQSGVGCSSWLSDLAGALVVFGSESNVSNMPTEPGSEPFWRDRSPTLKFPEMIFKSLIPVSDATEPNVCSRVGDLSRGSLDWRQARIRRFKGCMFNSDRCGSKILNPCRLQTWPWTSDVSRIVICSLVCICSGRSGNSGQSSKWLGKNALLQHDAQDVRRRVLRRFLKCFS